MRERYKTTTSRYRFGVFGIITLAFMLIIITSPIQAIGFSSKYEDYETGKITKVIDGDAAVILIGQNGNYHAKALKLIGVDCQGNQAAFEYTKNQILGKKVYITYDPKIEKRDQEFYNVYLFMDQSTQLNQQLLALGLAELNSAHSQSKYYAQYLSANADARLYEQGIYQNDATPTEIININLASRALLIEHLGIDQTTASQIEAYRRQNPINSVRELGFVSPQLTRELLHQKKAGLHCVTNINSATTYELASLFRSNPNDNVDAIYNTRLYRPIAGHRELNKIGYIGLELPTIRDFITYQGTDYDFQNPEQYVVNVNTAAKSELQIALKLSDTTIAKLVSYRKLHSPIYSLQELGFSKNPLFDKNVLYYQDDIHCITEVNTANKSEIISLFSLFDLGLNRKTELADQFIKNRPYYSYQELQAQLGSQQYQKLLPFIEIAGMERPYRIDTGKYLNINQCSLAELKQMSKYATTFTAMKTLNYRSQYPIYNKTDLYQLFKEINQLYIYNDIVDKIVYY